MNLIDIRNYGEHEPEMLAACMEKLNGYTSCTATIFVNPRQRDNWLEYGIQIGFLGGGSLFLGAVQRTVGASIEFNS